MAKQVGLNTWLNRTTNQFLTEISSGGMTLRFPALLFDDGAGTPISNVDWIHAPDLSAVSGFATKYWIITGDVVTLMDPATRAVLDAAELVAARDAISAQLDQQEGIIRAFMLAVLDEFNGQASKMNEILDAIDGANSLSEVKTAIAAITDYPQRTTAQLRSVVRGKLGT